MTCLFRERAEGSEKPTVLVKIMKTEESTSKMITNEFREKLTYNEKTEIVNRIRKLTGTEIDELWFGVGFVYSDKDNNKALKDEYIKEIKNSPESAELYFESLFQETHLEKIYAKLKEIEEASKT